MIAALLLACLRDAVSGPVPMILINKPQPGCGGSLLTDVVSLVATGRPAQMVQASRDSEEWRKLLTGILMSGDRFVLFDNVDHILESESLASFITAQIWKDRPLGVSQPVQLPNRTVCFANGNNIKVGGNLARRIVLVSLDSRDSQPWMRDSSTFRHPDLRQWVRDNRGAIISSVLTIVRGWVNAGRPKAKCGVSLGGFEAYARLLGDILAYAGIQGFLSNLAELYASLDVDTPVWATFLEVWQQVIGDEPITCRELVVRLAKNSQLRAALPSEIAHAEQPNYSHKLGNKLAKRERQKFPNGLRLVRAGKYRGAVLWRVESFDRQTHQTHTNLGSNGSFESLLPPYARSEKEQGEQGNIEKGSTDSQNSQIGVRNVSLACANSLDTRITAILGMPAEEAVTIWRKDGAQVIFLGPGGTCLDLELLLSKPDVGDSQLQAVRAWLEKRR